MKAWTWTLKVVSTVFQSEKSVLTVFHLQSWLLLFIAPYDNIKSLNIHHVLIILLLAYVYLRAWGAQPLVNVWFLQIAECGYAAADTDSHRRYFLSDNRAQQHVKAESEFSYSRGACVSVSCWQRRGHDWDLSCSYTFSTCLYAELPSVCDPGSSLVSWSWAPPEPLRYKHILFLSQLSEHPHTYSSNTLQTEVS